MIGPTNWVVGVTVCATVVRVGRSVVVVVVVVLVVVDVLVLVVDVLVLVAVAGVLGVASVVIVAGVVANANGVAVRAIELGVQPVTVTVPPSAAADVDGHASQATPPATNAPTTPMPRILLRCSSPSPDSPVRVNVPSRRCSRSSGTERMMRVPEPMTQEWLDLVDEEVLDPGQRIVDPHHHLWPAGGVLPYGLAELHADAVGAVTSSSGPSSSSAGRSTERTARRTLPRSVRPSSWRARPCAIRTG